MDAAESLHYRFVDGGIDGPSAHHDHRQLTVVRVLSFVELER
jgi:hypothetical protein